MGQITHRGIQPPVNLVETVINRNHLRARSHRLLDLDCLTRRFLNRTVDLAADAGQQGRARRPSLRTSAASPVLSQRCRPGSGARRKLREPPPEARICSTGIPSSLKISSESRRLKATPSRMERITWARVWAAVSPNHMPRACASRYGRALAHQVGEPQQAQRCPGGTCLGFLDDQIVSIETVCRAYQASEAPKLSRNQREREPRALGHAHHVPLAGHGVAEGVDAAARVELGRFGVSKDHAGSAEGGGGEAGLDNAVADGAGRLVAAAADHRRSRLQARVSYAVSRRDLAGDFRGLVDARQKLSGRSRGPRASPRDQRGG